MSRAGQGRRPVRSTKEQHRQWLQLVETDGPFLSIPVLTGSIPKASRPWTPACWVS